LVVPLVVELSGRLVPFVAATLFSSSTNGAMFHVEANDSEQKSLDEMQVMR
jgi:hypothetical protein